MKIKGNWVIKTSMGGYWCGPAHFDRQIRKAQIYHWKEAAEEQIEVIKKRKYISDSSITLEVIEVVPPQELKDTEAEWIPHGEGEDGNEIVYECSSCRYCALNDYRGNSTDSRFCPHCGKFMINSTMPEDE